MIINMNKIGVKIKTLRENANLTQTHVAEFLAVDQSLISKFEKGERSISSDMLDELATLFCCPLSALISDNQEIACYNIAFRTNAIGSEDLSILSVINKIALNQIEMDKMAGGKENGR